MKNQKSADLASKLWPFLAPKICRLAEGVSTSVGSVESGAPSPHQLNSIHHEGTIGDAQAPQFLKRDGARSLLGDLSVVSGVTIDGVDISTHAADPAAHHNPVTAGNTAIGVSVQQVSLVLAEDSGLEIDNGLLMGDPGDLDVNSVSTRDGNIHYHAIDHSSNPGAAAKILSSTGSGGITLQNLTVEGDIDVINNGDLTVGPGATPALYVNNTGDPSTANVGINCVADPQFALDVDGPIRGTYLVGPHAIQLDNAKAIMQYDGPWNNEGLWVGQLETHMGVGATSKAGGIVFPPGKFGRALSMGRNTYNQVTNPSFETNTSGWASLHGDTLSRSDTVAWSGLYSLQISYVSGTFASARHIFADASDGQNWAVQCMVYVPLGWDGGMPQLSLYQDDMTLIDSMQATEVGEWQLLTAAGMLPAGEGPGRIVIAASQPSAAGKVFYIDAVQAEKRAFCTPYLDGSLNSYVHTAASHTWDGTEHGSISFRYPPLVGYPSYVLPRVQGTIMAWVQAPWGNTPTAVDDDSYLFVAGATNLRLWRKASSNELWLSIGDGSIVSSTPAWDLDWHHIAVAWSNAASEAAIYFDGELLNSDTLSGVVEPQTLYVGSGSGQNHYWNGLIDCLAIVGKRMDADEIRAVYESDAPVFAETARMSWRATPLQLVWADDKGLWMRDAAGKTTLGVYGGLEGGESWGGATLDTGDLLIGSAAHNAYVKWDNSASELEVKGSIIVTGGSGIVSFGDAGGLVTKDNVSWSAEVTNRPDELTDGRISAGLNASGDAVRKVLPGSNVGTPEGEGLYLGADKMGYFSGSAWKTYTDNAGNFYFGGAAGATVAWDGLDLYGTDGTDVQWYARSTDGKLYAGGGNVILDEDGITIDAVEEEISETNKIKFLRYNGGKMGEMYQSYESLLTYSDFVLRTGMETGVNGRITLHTNNAANDQTTIMYLTSGDAATWGFEIQHDGSTMFEVSDNQFSVSSDIFGVYIGPETHIYDNLYVDQFAGQLALDAASVAIASGAITVSAPVMFLASETGSSDNLTTINPSDGVRILVCLQNQSGHTITIKDGTGNINLPSGDIVLNNIDDNIWLWKRYAAGPWTLFSSAGY